MPASLSTFPNCIPVQPVFTPPTVFDNVFWDNRAGSYAGGFVHGIGLPGDSASVNHWDLGAYGVAPANALKPVKNDIQDLTGHTNYNNRGNVSIWVPILIHSAVNFPFVSLGHLLFLR